MRAHEIRIPPSHPHVAEVVIDPVMFGRLSNLIDDARELRLIRVEDDQPDVWVVHVGCASEAVRERLLDRWA